MMKKIGLVSGEKSEKYRRLVDFSGFLSIFPDFGRSFRIFPDFGRFFRILGDFGRFMTLFDHFSGSFVIFLFQHGLNERSEDLIWARKIKNLEGGEEKRAHYGSFVSKLSFKVYFKNTIILKKRFGIWVGRFSKKAGCMGVLTIIY